MSAIDEILSFWFAEGMKEKWFVKSDAFDAEVRDCLGAHYEKAAAGAYDDWTATARGSLALCLLLDQVPRNLFRNSPKAFASDARARDVTYHAIRSGYLGALAQIEQIFLLLPLEHSETLADQQLCCELTRPLDEDPGWQDYALAHKKIIERFGRFPHRNAVLGRVSTAEEEAFLQEPGSSF